jgi:hypothetical protein
MGYDTPAAMQFILRYRSQRAAMDDWLAHLTEFAGKLSNAADEIQTAAAKRVLVAGGAPRSLPVRPGEMPTHRAATPPAPETPLTAYVADVNEGLYRTLLGEQRDLLMGRLELGKLMDARAETAAELAALRERLSATGADGGARLDGLRDQLASLDSQIADTRERITGLEASIASATERLERVKPGAGADLGLIRGLIDTETPQWIKDATQDCVRYITERMPIPPGIPVTAHLWDEQAAKFAQYGITSGDMPLVGSVLVMEPQHPYADDRLGHLMYVERVAGGEVWVTDNNHSDPVKLSELTDELTGEHLRYLYFPWHTRA